MLHHIFYRVVRLYLCPHFPISLYDIAFSHTFAHVKWETIYACWINFDNYLFMSMEYFISELLGKTVRSVAIAIWKSPSGHWALHLMTIYKCTYISTSRFLTFHTRCVQKIFSLNCIWYLVRYDTTCSQVTVNICVSTLTRIWLLCLVIINWRLNKINRSDSYSSHDLPEKLFFFYL